jgi:hypothetical protein
MSASDFLQSPPSHRLRRLVLDIIYGFSERARQVTRSAETSATNQRIRAFLVLKLCRHAYRITALGTQLTVKLLENPRIARKNLGQDCTQHYSRRRLS